MSCTSGTKWASISGGTVSMQTIRCRPSGFQAEGGHSIMS